MCHLSSLVPYPLQLRFENDLSKTIQCPIKIDTVFDYRDFPHSRLIGIDEVSQKVFDR